MQRWQSWIRELLRELIKGSESMRLSFAFKFVQRNTTRVCLQRAARLTFPRMVFLGLQKFRPLKRVDLRAGPKRSVRVRRRTPPSPPARKQGQTIQLIKYMN